MPSTSERFDAIDLHDAPILAIERRDGAIVLRLGHANLLAEHPANPGATAVCVRGCVLVLRGVGVERSRLFDDATQAWVEHPSPDAPLSAEIVEASAHGDGTRTVFGFSGMHDAGWSEWELSAEGFTLDWELVAGDAWFVGWPRSRA